MDKESGMMREERRAMEFVADGDVEAVRGAIAWSRDRLAALYDDGSRELSSLKVYTKVIGSINSEGRGETRLGTPVFEWKDGGFYTLDEALESFIHRYERG
jgi:hypothetical protein